MKSSAKMEKEEISEAKALAALKNHSEAERRRRERISGHLATLRGLVPSTAKVCFFFFSFFPPSSRFIRAINYVPFELLFHFIL